MLLDPHTMEQVIEAMRGKGVVSHLGTLKRMPWCYIVARHRESGLEGREDVCMLVVVDRQGTQ